MSAIAPKHPRIRDNKYLAFLRQEPCCVCHRPAPSDAAHIRMASTVYGKRSTGMAEKPDDKWALALCRPIIGIKAGCHKDQHSMGEAEFWRERGLNPFEIAMRLYAIGGHPGDPQPPKRKRTTIAPRGFQKGKRKMQSRRTFR